MQVDTYQVNYCGDIDMSSLIIISHIDRNSLVPAMSSTNMDFIYHLEQNWYIKGVAIYI